MEVRSDRKSLHRQGMATHVDWNKTVDEAIVRQLATASLVRRKHLGSPSPRRRQMIAASRRARRTRCVVHVQSLVFHHWRR